MSRWRDRGYVQDSDEEVELDLEASDNEDIHKQAASPVSRPSQVEEQRRSEEDYTNDGGQSIQAAASDFPAGTKAAASLEPSEFAGVDGQRIFQEPDGQVAPAPENDIDDLQDDASLLRDTARKPLATATPSSSPPKLQTKSDAVFRQPLEELLSSPLSERSVSPPFPEIFSDLVELKEDGTVFREEVLPGNVEVVISRKQGEERNEEKQQERRRDAIQAAAEEAAQEFAYTQNGRSFRKRNPIQLHPYLLEQERYRQIMKAKGIRPVMLPGQSNRNETQTSDSQDHEFLETQPSSPPDSSHADNHAYSPPRKFIPPHTSADDLNLGDNLNVPDLNSATESAALIAPQRRKIARTFSRKHDRTLSRTQLGRKNAYKAQDSRPSTDVFDVPPSPPTSHVSPQPSSHGGRRRRFIVPPGVQTPLQPLTPIPSSETRHIPHDAARENSDEDSPPQSTSRRRSGLSRVRSIVILSSSSSSDGASDEEEELRVVQKRIKGVLPASWLRLDLQSRTMHQEPKKNASHRASSHDQPEPQRGVAQRIKRSGRRDHTDRGEDANDTKAIPVLDTSETDSELTDTTITPVLPFDTDREPRPATELGENLIRSGVFDPDIEEEDWIDPMFPSTSTLQKPRSRQSRKRQVKLTDGFGLSRKKFKTSDKVFKAVPPEHRPAKDRPSKRKVLSKSSRVKTTKAPMLSILDVNCSPESGRDVPQFIRVAARQARKQRDQGRHSPTRKHIRLHTRADTEDANKTLQQWREGAIQSLLSSVSTSSGSKPHRLPRDHGGNRQQYLPPPLGEWPSHTGLDGSDQSIDRARPRLRQTRLEPVVVPRDGATSSNHGDTNASVTSSKVRGRPRLKDPNYRTAQLEGLETDFRTKQRKIAFRKKLSNVDHQFIQQLQSGSISSNVQLARFLQDEDAVNPVSEQVTPQEQGRNVGEKPSAPLAPLGKPRRKRKRHVRRLDIETREYRQPSDPPLDQILHDQIEAVEVEEESQVLLGLGGFGTRYTTDFDILPFQIGTYFHPSTLLGSGEFSRSMRLLERNLDISTGYTIAEMYSHRFRWSSWTDEVSSQLADGFRHVCENLERISSQDQSSSSSDDRSQGDLTFLRSAIRYISDSLSFLDPIDRRSFVMKLSKLLDQSYSTVLPLIQDTNATDITQQGNSHGIRHLTLFLVLSSQTRLIACQSRLEDQLRIELDKLIISLSRASVELILRRGMSQIRAFSDENRRHTEREAGIRNDKPFVESLVVLHHVLRQADINADSNLWGIVTQTLSPQVHSFYQLHSFEKLWYDIFALLPFAEFDDYGVLKPGQRFRAAADNWGLVKSILLRLFALYPQTAKGHSVSINSYIRAVLTRCYNLVHRWGWRRCEPALGVTFDFFARRGLAHLPNEESRGSPRFLEELHRAPSLEVLPEDRAFHIFLKMLGIGVRGLRFVYSDKKISSITWRYVPNHGRTYRKDESVRQEDLDALRNHHDLMCTLYWATPPSFRPRLDLIRHLVDHSSSHREACRLSVQAWSRLVRFQLSTDEPLSSLDPFAAWFLEIVQQTMLQYRLARTEAESQFEAAKTHGNDTISPELLQATIAGNQIQVLAALSDAVAGMKQAVKVSERKEPILYLLRHSDLPVVFRMFDPKKLRVNSVIVESLEVFQELGGLLAARSPDAPQGERSEESQDYGDFPDLDDMIDIDEAAPQTATFDFIQEPLWHLLSSCFGAETPPDERLLTKAVDTWVQVAQFAVQAGERQWSNYLDDYSPSSWRQLRDTEQTRQYGPYFLASVLASDSRSHEENRNVIIPAWLVSLVERESMLKFQHRLTSVLLNVDGHHPLLQNLPLVKDVRTGRFDIKASELRERRLAIISSILSNMRDSYESVIQAQPLEAPALRRDYTQLLKQLMAAMKNNYLEIQQGSNVKGVYVEFVHHIVEYLQQYTSDICSVDKFFTDSGAFPLPATDPTYVVGRLKSYALKLGDPRTTKQLAVFIQTVSERAAIDAQQAYLTNQLVSAMSSTWETSVPHKLTLRRILLQAIFPAYIDLAFSTPAGWILATPMLHASTLTFRTLLYDFSVTDESSLEAVASLLLSTLGRFRDVVEVLVDHSGLLEQAHVLHVLAALLDTVTATLPLVDYLRRRMADRLPAAALLPRHIAFFTRFTVFVAETVLGSPAAAAAPYSDEADAEPGASVLPVEPLAFASVREFCARELGRAMTGGGWEPVAEGRYTVVRGPLRAEVAVALGGWEEEKARLVRAIEGFHQLLNRLGMAGERGRGRESGRDPEGVRRALEELFD